MRAKDKLHRCTLFFVILLFGVVAANQGQSKPKVIRHGNFGKVIPANVAVFFGGPGGGNVGMGLNFLGPTTNCSSDCTKQMGTLGSSMKVTFTATPDGDSLFAGWGGGLCSGASPTCTVDLSSSMRVIAYFRSAYRMVAAGDSHTCALLPAGKITCWGRNDHAQLGAGNINLLVGPVVGINNAVAIAAGGSHTCALLADGTVSCWGTDTYGESGIFNFQADVLIPTSVSGISDAVAVTAGGFHSCILHAGGTASCWGANNHGQLGNNSNFDTALPVTVNLAVVGPLSRIAAGGYHTCGIITANSRVACWGANNHGQLGNNSRVDAIMPIVTVVAGGDPGCPGTFSTGCGNLSLPITPLPGIVAIAASSGGGQEFHTVALDRSDMDWGWGNNNDGEINMGIGGEQDAAQHGVVAPPITVFPRMIAAGAFHTCIASRLDGVLCRGSNYFGQAGPTPNTGAHKDAVPTTIGARGLATGAYHTCAVVEGAVFPSGPPGTVVCWGDNDNGQVTSMPSPGSNVTAPFVIPFLPP